MKIAVEIGDKAMEGNCYTNLGGTYSYLGEYQKAIEYMQEGLEIAVEIGNKAAAAILFIDHQTGLMPLVNDISEGELKNNVLALVKAARIHKLPTILTTSNHEGPNGPLMRVTKGNS